MTGRRELHIAIPGLSDDLAAEAFDRIPALARLIGRAEAGESTPSGLEELLAGLFGLAPPPGSDPPLGAITREAEEGDAGGFFWALAEPVHQRPDLADAHLDPVAIETEEASALARLFNDHFDDRGLSLMPSSRGGRFTLRFPADPQIKTINFSRVVATPLRGLQPRGPGAARWLSLLTEIQMLFHGAPLNQNRAEGGLPEVNGLWVWGVGRLPAAPRPGIALAAVDGSRVAADMARVAGVPLVDGITGLLADGGGWPRLMVGGGPDGDNGREGVTFDSDLCAAVDRALRRCIIDRLHIHYGARESLAVAAGWWPVVRARLGLARPPAVIRERA